METVTQTILQYVACPECGSNMTTSMVITVREAAEEDGRLQFYYGLKDMEIIGGCEHAEELRENVDFHPER